jgi:hypothetical protein
MVYARLFHQMDGSERTFLVSDFELTTCGVFVPSCLFLECGAARSVDVECFGRNDFIVIGSSWKSTVLASSPFLICTLMDTLLLRSFLHATCPCVCLL